MPGRQRQDCSQMAGVQEVWSPSVSSPSLIGSPHTLLLLPPRCERTEAIRLSSLCICTVTLTLLLLRQAGQRGVNHQAMDCNMILGPASTRPLPPSLYPCFFFVFLPIGSDTARMPLTVSFTPLDASFQLTRARALGAFFFFFCRLLGLCLRRNILSSIKELCRCLPRESRLIMRCAAVRLVSHGGVGLFVFVDLYQKTFRLFFCHTRSNSVLASVNFSPFFYFIIFDTLVFSI